jgi:hypothetical protein
LTHVQVIPVPVEQKEFGVEQAAPTAQTLFATPPVFDPVAPEPPAAVAPVLAAEAPLPGVAAVAPVPDPYHPPALYPLLLELPEPFVEEEQAPSSRTKPETLAVLALNIFVIPFKPETSTSLVPRLVDGETRQPAYP